MTKLTIMATLMAVASFAHETLASNLFERAGPATLAAYVDSNGQTVTPYGCFADNSTARTFTVPPPASAPDASHMTPDGCAFACASTNNPYSGTEYGGECYCSLTAPAASLSLDSSRCSSYCTGNATLACGGSNALSVYFQTLQSNQITNAASDSTVAFKGCGSASDTPVVAYTAFASASIDSCAQIAIAAGYPAFAVRDQACQVYSSAPTITTSSTASCDKICPGNARRYCGSSSSSPALLSFYSVNSTNVPEQASAGSLTVPSTDSTFVYQGCVVDSITSRTLNRTFAIAAVTPQKCANRCSQEGFSYAGLENGAECWCDNQAKSSGTLIPPVNSLTTLIPSCIMPCTGDATKSCGGSNAMQLYKIASIAGFPSASQAATLSPNNKGETVAYQGCYQDNSTDPSVRIFPLKVQPSSGTITPTSCTRACSHYVAFDNSGAPINYAYAGLQYGAECWCSNLPPPFAKVLPQVACAAMACAGDSQSWCGGGNVMAVYQSTPPATPSIVNTFRLGTYQGCAASTAFQSFFTYMPASAALKITVETCVNACKGEGYSYAGLSVQGSNSNTQCDCSNNAPSTFSGTCSSPCSGGSGKEICGSASSYSVYATNVSGVKVQTGVTINQFATTYTTASNYLGCYVDSTTSRLLASRVYTLKAEVITPSTCLDACTLMGLPYAGVEYGQECYCSATAPKVFTGSVLDAAFGRSGDCNMPCSGNTTLACGAGNRISVYYNGGSQFTQSVGIGSALSNGYIYQGCASDQWPTGRVLLNLAPIPSGTNTPLVCSNQCASMGYVYAGVEYGEQCFCASSFTGSILNSETSCNMACPGDPSKFCGGSNALSVFYNANIQRVTLNSVVTSGTTWTYQACWGEPQDANGQHGSFRSLPHPLNNNAQLTVSACLQLGLNAGYNVCGLEYGGECWCDTLASNVNPQGGQVPESFCSVPCRGLITSTCGGNYVLSVYRRS